MRRLTAVRTGENDVTHIHNGEDGSVAWNRYRMVTSDDDGSKRLDVYCWHKWRKEWEIVFKDCPRDRTEEWMFQSCDQ